MKPRIHYTKPSITERESELATDAADIQLHRGAGQLAARGLTTVIIPGMPCR